jgi:hypothetical protein
VAGQRHEKRILAETGGRIQNASGRTAQRASEGLIAREAPAARFQERQEVDAAGDPLAANSRFQVHALAVPAQLRRLLHMLRRGTAQLESVDSRQFEQILGLGGICVRREADRAAGGGIRG